MAITGAHVLLYSSEPEALRAVLRDVFEWKHVDAGHGWLIFALPPAEIAVHPVESPAEHAGMQHQLTLFCDDITATIRDLRAKGIIIDGQPQNQGWGITVMMTLPGGVDVMLYQPQHPIAVHS